MVRLGCAQLGSRFSRLPDGIAEPQWTSRRPRPSPAPRRPGHAPPRQRRRGGATPRRRRRHGGEHTDTARLRDRLTETPVRVVACHRAVLTTCSSPSRASPPTLSRPSAAPSPRTPAAVTQALTADGRDRKCVGGAFLPGARNAGHNGVRLTYRTVGLPRLNGFIGDRRGPAEATARPSDRTRSPGASMKPGDPHASATAPAGLSPPTGCGARGPALRAGPAIPRHLAGSGARPAGRRPRGPGPHRFRTAGCSAARPLPSAIRG